MTKPLYALPSQVDEDFTQPPPSPTEDYVGVWVRELIFIGSATSPRTLQRSLGASEIGSPCERQMVYKHLGIEPVNFDIDPLRTQVGTGVHLGLAELFRRLSGRSGRFLVEHPVSYRDIPGTLDLYDRWSKTLIDWKTSTLRRIKDMRTHSGVSPRYVVQGQIYGRAIYEQGERPEKITLAFIPLDGTLADIWCPTQRFDPQVADQAIDRYEAMIIARSRPSDAIPTPTRLCPWCDHYRNGSTDLDVACPGLEQDKK